VKVIWSPLAIDRAVEQAEYIARDKPGAARRWLSGLFVSVAKLSTLPRMGRVVPELASPEFREIDDHGYRVIYRLEGRTISILTVRHGRRLLDLGELGGGPGSESGDR
jgi:plasmid stabilization system protein ParE